jgi:hypothetical protein
MLLTVSHAFQNKLLFPINVLDFVMETKHIYYEMWTEFVYITFLNLGPELYLNCTITLRHTAQSVGLLWTGDQPEAFTSNWQYTTLKTDRHRCAGGIRTRNSSKRSAADNVLNCPSTGIKIFICIYDYWDHAFGVSLYKVM